MKKIVTNYESLVHLIEQAVGITHPKGPEKKNPAVINEPAPNDDVPISTFDSKTDFENSTSPPVDDEEFLPANVVELSRALAVLSRDVPPEKIEGVYRDVKKIIEKCAETKKKEDEAPKYTGEEKVNKLQENNVRSAIRKILSESDDYEGGYEGARGTKKKFAREMSLDDVAKEVGLAGASGARQLINIAAQRMKFIMEMDPDDRDEIVTRAAGDYIKFLIDSDKKAPGEGLSKEDIQFLRDHPQHIAQLDGFRDFLKKYWNAAMRDAGVKDTPPPDIAGTDKKKKGE